MTFRTFQATDGIFFFFQGIFFTFFESSETYADQSLDETEAEQHFSSKFFAEKLRGPRNLQ